MDANATPGSSSAPPGDTTVRVAGWVAVRVAGWVAIAWAVFSAAGAAYLVLTALLAPSVPITIPVETFWPRLPVGTEYDGTTATLEQGGFTAAQATELGLSGGVRVCWAVSQALWWLIPGAIATLVAVVSFRLRSGRPLVPALVGLATATAVIVALGGVTAQALGDIAGYQGGVEMLAWTSAQYPDVAALPDSDLSTWLPRPRFEITFPFWPVAAGLGFAALAAVFRCSSRLQRETEGLV